VCVCECRLSAFPYEKEFVFPPITYLRYACTRTGLSSQNIGFFLQIFWVFFDTYAYSSPIKDTAWDFEVKNHTGTTIFKVVDVEPHFS
jgi:hypothetical protein